MNCEHYAEAIDELIDGTLDQGRRSGLEAHLAQCEACRALVADLGALRSAAAALPARRPPDRVWDHVSAHLPAGDPPPVTGDEQPARRLFGAVFAPRWRLAWGAALTVALAIVLLAVALPRLIPDGRQAAPDGTAPTTAARVHAGDTDLVQSVESELQLAAEHYEKAIAGLEQMAKAGEGALDPQVAATLERNLTVIDQAIQESRAALQSQPTSEMAQESLFEAFRRKVGLLQDTVALINEMRKGNQAEAAKIIGSMNKS